MQRLQKGYPVSVLQLPRKWMHCSVAHTERLSQTDHTVNYVADCASICAASPLLRAVHQAAVHAIAHEHCTQETATRKIGCWRHAVEGIEHLLKSTCISF